MMLCSNMDIFGIQVKNQKIPIFWVAGADMYITFIPQSSTEPSEIFICVSKQPCLTSVLSLYLSFLP